MTADGKPKDPDDEEGKDEGADEFEEEKVEEFCIVFAAMGVNMEAARFFQEDFT